MCSKEFKQKSHLKTHLKNLHSIITPSAKEVEQQRQQQATAQAVIQQQQQPGSVARAVTQTIQPVAVIKTAPDGRAVTTQMQPISIIQAPNGQLQPQALQMSGQQINGQPIYMKIDPS